MGYMYRDTNLGVGELDGVVDLPDLLRGRALVHPVNEQVHVAHPTRIPVKERRADIATTGDRGHQRERGGE